MDGSGNQARPQRVDRALVSRVLALLQSTGEISVDLDEEDQLDERAFAALLHRVQRRHQASSLFARIPLGNSIGDQILGPGRGVPSSGAVLLAFHAGARVNLDRLTAATGIDMDDAGAALYQARVALIGDETEACDHMKSRAGCYADPSIDQKERIALVNHANACERCGLILSEFQAIDDWIRDAVAEAPVTAPADPDERSSLLRNPLLLLVPMVLAIVVAIAVLTAIGFGSASQSSASPLLAAGDPAAHRGWLILSSDQEIMAFDLESGERRRILEQPAHDWWNPWVISPNAELAVRWEEYSRVEQRLGALRAYDMQGERQYLHRWRGVRARTFSGWLDDRTVLFTERGPIQRIGVKSETPQSAQPSLIAADLETGEEWVVYQGPMDKAVPSPDGRNIAVVRPARAPWPGKSVEVLPLIDDVAGEPIVALAHRLLSWPGRILWSDDSESVYFSAIHREDVPDPLPQQGEAAPGPYDLERLHIVALGIDGTVAEYDTSSSFDGWVVPQAVNPKNGAIAVALNDRFDRDNGWYHGVVDLESGEMEFTDLSVPGSRWWNSEAIWSPSGDDLLVQQVISQRFGIDTEEGTPGSLVVQSMEPSGAVVPAMVFQDTTSLNLRSGEGLALLRWVPDEAMAGDRIDSPTRPIAGVPRALSQATSKQQLNEQSSIAATGRYVLLSQQDPDAGNRKRLIHLQAWAGTESDLNGTGDYAWLPREPAVIGTTIPDPDEQRPSRLIFVSANRISPLHGLQIDPAGIGDRMDLAYRKPLVSPNGSHLAFFVHHEQHHSVELWVDLWDRDPVSIADWDHPDDTRIDPSLNLHWTSDREFIYSTVSQWDDGYPIRVALMRGELREDGGIESSEIRSFNARGRDRGIDLRELSIGHDEERIAFRLRHFTGSDLEDSASDVILVSPTQDLSQHIEIVRSGTGDGMTWLNGDQWLIASIDERIALLEATGRESENLSDAPAAFPVLVGPGEVWYQDLSDDGLIMRIAFE